MSRFLDLLSIRRCIMCTLESNHGTLCMTCAGDLPETLWSPSFRVEGVDQLYCMGDYSLLTGQLVRFAKYGKREDAARTLGKNLAHALRHSSIEFDAITPVPQSWTSSLWRGFSLTEILATHLGETAGKPVIHSLHRTSGRRLAGVAAHHRQVIAMSQFSARKTQVQDKILLIDDVLTTGSTARACASLLKKQGVKTVILIAACSPKI